MEGTTRGKMELNEILKSGSIPEGMDAMFVSVCPNAPSAEYAALGGLSVADWEREPIFTGHLGWQRACRYEAIATTDHAASSYGLPVVVLPDGTAIGPQDRVYRHLSYVVLAAELNPMFARLRQAGYRVEAEEI